MYWFHLPTEHHTFLTMTRTIHHDSGVYDITLAGVTPQLTEEAMHQQCIRMIESYLCTGSIMFACSPLQAASLYDVSRRRGIAGRDRLGLIPFYWTGDHQQIAVSFSSRQLVEQGYASRKAKRQSLDDFLCLQYIPGTATMWKDVQRIAPGTELSWSYESYPLLQRYWDFPFLPKEVVEEERQEALLHLLTAIYASFAKDEQTLCLLSGGIDTSCNAAFLTQNNSPFSAVTTTFTESAFNEWPFAVQVAKHYGCPHYQVLFTPEKLMHLSEMLNAFDEPCGDQAALATFLALQEVPGQYHMLYTGEGGDEGFGLPRRFPLVENIAPGDMSALATYYTKALQYLSVDLRTSLYRTSLQRDIDSTHVQNLYQQLFEQCPGSTQLSKLFYAQAKTWLVDNVLAKDRQVAQAKGDLLLSTPLAHPEIFSLMTTIPEERFEAALQNKAFLRSVMQKILPQEVLTKPKHTFLVPMQHWFTNPHVIDAQFLPLLQHDHPLWEWLEYDRVAQLVSQQREGINLSLPLWQILSFATWLKSSPITL